MESPAHLCHVATMAALKAGALLRKAVSGSFAIANKPGVLNLVTEYDTAAEKIILATIQEAFPDHGILAEESGKSRLRQGAVTWMIDPIDGTSNFAFGLPLFVVSIAAVIDQEVLAGVVYDPSHHELYTAIKGQGAYLNGTRLAVAKKEEIGHSLLLTGFPADLSENPYNCLDLFTAISKYNFALRDLGAAALNMSYLAAGRAHGYWCAADLSCWDIAAGKLLVEEAGGKVSAIDGSAYDLYAGGPILAANKTLHAALSHVLRLP